MSRTQLEAMTATRRKTSGEDTSAQRRGWLHVCNGLDPVRDGGMVPSILGMTSALSRLRGEVTIVTPTPSRLDTAQLAQGPPIRGPEADLEQAVRSAEIGASARTLAEHARVVGHVRPDGPASHT